LHGNSTHGRGDDDEDEDDDVDDSLLSKQIQHSLSGGGFAPGNWIGTWYETIRIETIVSGPTPEFIGRVAAFG